MPASLQSQVDARRPWSYLAFAIWVTRNVNQQALEVCDEPDELLVDVIRSLTQRAELLRWLLAYAPEDHRKVRTATVYLEDIAFRYGLGPVRVRDGAAHLGPEQRKIPPPLETVLPP